MVAASPVSRSLAAGHTGANAPTQAYSERQQHTRQDGAQFVGLQIVRLNKSLIFIHTSAILANQIRKHLICYNKATN